MSVIMLNANINKSDLHDKFFNSIKTITAFTKVHGEGNGTRYKLERTEVELYRTSGASVDKLSLPSAHPWAVTTNVRSAGSRRMTGRKKPG